VNTPPNSTIVEVDGRNYEIRRPSFGIQKMILERFGTANEELKTLKLLEKCIKVEAGLGTGAFRALREQEFDEFDDLSFEPLRAAFIELQPLKRRQQALAQQLLENLPAKAPPEVRDYLADLAFKTDAEGKDEPEDPFGP
jgi:hypothetical protein